MRSIYVMNTAKPSFRVMSPGTCLQVPYGTAKVRILLGRNRARLPYGTAKVRILLDRNRARLYTLRTAYYELTVYSLERTRAYNRGKHNKSSRELCIYVSLNCDRFWTLLLPGSGGL